MAKLVTCAVAIAVITAAGDALAQPGRPSATVVARPATTDIVAGAETVVTLHVTLPANTHVQANKPDDPFLIPTVVTVTPPPGVAVTAVTYPTTSPFVQEGRTDPLHVFGPEFDINVALALSPTAGSGVIEIPVVLRYQVCNETTCFPPARASATWRLNVRSPR